MKNNQIQKHSIQSQETARLINSLAPDSQKEEFLELAVNGELNIQSLALKNQRLNKGVPMQVFDRINSLSTDSQKANFLELAVQGKFDAKVALSCITQTPTKYYEGCMSVTTVQKAFEEKTPTLAQLKKYLGREPVAAFLILTVENFIKMYGMDKALSEPVAAYIFENCSTFSIAELHFIFNKYILKNAGKMFGESVIQIISVINLYIENDRMSYLETRHKDTSRRLERVNKTINTKSLIKPFKPKEALATTHEERERIGKERAQRRRDELTAKLKKGASVYEEVKKSHKPEPEATESNKEFIEKYTP